MNRLMIRGWFILVVVSLVPAMRAGLAWASGPPNIVFILADDLAWNDLASGGHPWHETPNLDRLAAAGMRFTQAYAPAPICSAARASILTGKSPARLGFEFVTKAAPGRQQRRAGQSLETPPFTLNLSRRETTIAETLATAGYETAFFGKWHLNAHHNGYLGWSPMHGPRQQGFATAQEEFGSHPYGSRDTGPPEPIDTPGEFPPDALTRLAVDFLGQAHQRPYFLMLSHFYVHTPIETPCRWLVKKYEQRVPADAPNRRRRIAYAAVVEMLDHYVGQVLAALDATGARDETLVIFTSDNGGHPQYTAGGPLRGSKWNLYEAGIRVPLVARWPARIRAGSQCPTPVIGYDLPATLAEVARTRMPPGERDGRSLVALFDDPSVAWNRALYWHFPYYHPERGFERARPTIGVDDFAVSQTRPHSAIRRGRYKLLYFYEQQRRELYRLDDSTGREIASENAPVARQLGDELAARLKAVGARLPVPAANGRP